jgi:transposase-like protein
MQITQPTETAKTEVAPKARRRSFTTEYKLSILERADRCKNGGDVGRLLRQEGLYSSHLTTWRSARREGTLKALGRKRGPKAGKSAEQLELERLQRENERLRKKLAHAERILDVQKKLSEVLGVPLQGDEDETNENS